MKAVVIGAGAAGLMCAGGLAEAGHDVVLIEKNDRVGRKLFITGKGRCNLTNACDARAFFENVVTNPKFLNSAIYGFTPSDCMQFFESLDVKLKVERGDRVFPVSDKSNDIVKALERYALKNGVQLQLNEKAEEIVVRDAVVRAVKTDKSEYLCDVAVIATGGITYPVTGSTGDGYLMAQKLGHRIVAPVAALVPLIAKGVEGLQGLSLRNVGATVFSGDKKSRSHFGEMLFTHTGVSGPIILTLSSELGKICGKNTILPKGSYLSVDLKPALDLQTLDARIQREISAAPKATVKTILYTMMPKSLAPKVLESCGIQEDTKASAVTKKQRELLAATVKDLRFPLIGKEKADLGIITQGGVDVAQINPKDMQSKLIKGLYFAGEVADVDAYTGGFNLQIAFSTAKAVVRALSS